MAREELPARLNAASELVDAHVAAGRGDRPAILSGEERLSYSRLKEEVDRVGSALLRLGVGRGERVMLLLPDGPIFVASFLGAIKAGAVAVPVSTLLTPDDYRFLLEDSGAAVLIVSLDLHPRVEAATRGGRGPRAVVVAGGPAPAGCLAFEEWRASAAASLEAADTAALDPAFWLYTSGTTGQPKAAVHLHRGMLVAADLYARGVLGLRPEDLCFSVAKLFFAYGLGNGLYFPLRVGAAAVHLPGRPTPEAVFEVLKRHRPTVFFSVPTGYAGLLARGLSSLGRVRLAVSAGEHLPANIVERWEERFGVEVLDGIGSTEALHIFISNRPGEVRPGSTGRLVAGYEARIVDAEGREAPPGEIGDLLIRGASCSQAYWKRPAETARTLAGGWVRTGDKFHVDQAGWFWFHGRSDDMLKVSGYWVSPAEVEAVLSTHPAVLECGVVGETDSRGLVRPVAFVRLREGWEPSRGLERELLESLRGRLASYKLPRRLEFAAELPRTPTGKLQRFKLRARAAAEPGARR